MKDAEALLQDLANELLSLKQLAYSYDGGDISFDKAQQLVGQIKWQMTRHQ